MTRPHIPLVEDDPEISVPLKQFLGTYGLMTVSTDAEEAVELLAEGEVDPVLFDLMLPGENGLALSRRLRAMNAPHITMLTTLTEPTDCVVGLELGADDFICEPFDRRELEPRRSSGSEAVLRFSRLRLYPPRRCLRSPVGLRTPLAGAEADPLLGFFQNPREVPSRDALINLTRGEGFAIPTRSVAILVTGLRRRLAGDDPLAEVIRTVRTDGNAFQPQIVIE
jgi:two-component system OmpR family response regulator